MKILKGSFQGVELAIPNTGQVRPTVDHFKKNIFKKFDNNIFKVVWDLFAGSGGVGLEFLSRGVQTVVFVDELKSAINCIKANLGECQIKNPKEFASKNPLTILSNVSDFLETSTAPHPDLIFLDPPYDQGHVQKTLDGIFRMKSITDTTLICVEHANEKMDLKNFEIHSNETYGPKSLTVLRKSVL